MGKWINLVAEQNEGEKTVTEVHFQIEARLEKIAKDRSHPIDDLLDWHKDDLQDLAGKSDKDLQCIVCEYLDNITLYRGAQSETFKPHTVTCETCQHFTRGSHPHLGSCAAGEKGALLGLWDTHLRGCDKYIEGEPEQKIVNKPKLRVVK